MNGWFLIAAAASGATALLHVFAGGRFAARPLLDSQDLGFVAKYTNYYCWHLVTLTIVAMSGSFLYAALWPEGIELAVLATLMAASFAIWSLGLATWQGGRYRALPQWALFLGIAATGGIGLVTL